MIGSPPDRAGSSTRKRLPSPNVPQYDVSADGSRFLVLEPARSGGEPITFVLNWAAGLRP